MSVSFNQYRDAVDSTLLRILELVQREAQELREALQDAIEGNLSQEKYAAALEAFNAQSAQIEEAIVGLVSTAPSPTEPVEPGTPIEVPVAPEEPTSPSDTLEGGEGAISPEVPGIIVEPSPDGVGVDGGFQVDMETLEGGEDLL